MKRLTIKVRITLWCLLVTTLAAGAALNLLFEGERRMTLGYYQETLQSTAQIAAGKIQYDNGALEIDRDLDELPNVRVAIYDMNGELIYGQQRFDLPFEADIYRQTTGRTGVQWYVLDTRMDMGSHPDLWLRLFISIDSMANLFDHRSDLLLLILPVLIIFATLGGYLIARNAVKPVIRISRTAESIADGKDLNKRIALPGARDELYHLAQIFDDMLERLDKAFAREHRFTSDASHELRTPIAGILAQSEFALSDAADENDRRAALESIRSRAGDMSALIGKLLTLSRMDAGQMPIQPEPIDLAMMLEIAAMQMEEAAIEKGMSIIVEECPPTEVMCDQTMMMQAVLNLTGNAVKYGCPADGGGEIHLETFIRDDTAFITVSDNGPGVDPEKLPRIFDRFYQADDSRHHDGAGLGLSLVKQIVRLHNGDVFAENLPDGGCRFTIQIPRKGGIS